ncbi:MAG TPA: hypothetical protein VKK79_22090 [Candidatus Lokiarchaeia archaeon]|nr:hypothetical protein [Candidatus Lokiarchaeia archaeon]
MTCSKVDVIQFDKIIKGHRVFRFRTEYFEKTSFYQENLETYETPASFASTNDIEEEAEDPEKNLNKLSM